MSITPEARKKLIDLYSYLKAVSLRSYPPVKNIIQQESHWRLSELPCHECLFYGLAAGQDYWLKIKKPEIHRCPEPPDALKPWLGPGWDNVAIEHVSHQREIVQHDADGKPLRVLFDQSEAWREWIEDRRSWRQEALPANAALSLWNDFFSLNTRIKKEGESIELVLGNVVFSWQDLHHPILLKRCQLSYDAPTQTFTLGDAGTSTEFYSSFFADERFIQLPLKEWSKQLRIADPHPLGDITDWLKNVRGAFLDAQLLDTEPQGIQEVPTVGPAPILFLRKRGAGLTQFIDDVLQALPSVEDVPEPLLRIVGCYAEAAPVVSAETYSIGDNAYAGETDGILLSKQANAAQVTILRRLRRSNGVLVQGPPGTGKTHTIANLLGSLLAEGKSVLVTSHTSKALKVLRHQVAEPLQALCVPLLDNDKLSLADQKNAMRALDEGLNQDPAELARRAEASGLRLGQIQQELRTHRQNLETAVNGEYQPLLLAGKEYRPVDAAKEVAEGSGHHDWIPAPVAFGAPAPLSPEDLAALYKSNEKVPADLELELAFQLPSPDLVLSASAFTARTDEIQKHHAASDYDYRRELWSGHSSESAPLEGTIDELIKAVGAIPKADAETWRLAIVESVCQGQSGPSNVWALLCQLIEVVESAGRQSAPLLFEHHPSIPDEIEIDGYETTVGEIVAHLASGKSLSGLNLLLKPDWKAFIQASQVEGKRPKLRAHFEALQALAKLRQLRNRLRIRWEQQVNAHALPAIPDGTVEPERFAAQFVSKIRECLEWQPRYWLGVRSSLAAQGLKLADLDKDLPVFTHAYPQAARLHHMVTKLLPPVVAAEKKRRRVLSLVKEIDSAKECLSAFAEANVVRDLQRAIGDRSVVDYQQVYDRFDLLLKLKPVFDQRRQWLEKIRPVAPAWAAAIEQRRPPHDGTDAPGALGDAWRWRQYAQELDRREALSVTELQAEIEQRSAEARTVTTEIIRDKAWSGVIRRVGQIPEARAALVAWGLLMKNIGAGHGVNAAALKRQAKIEMEKARPCVPVWIMPFSRLVDNFRPDNRPFDVIIVDEASQEGPLGLAPFFMAKKVIIVGDDEQVTPLDVGGAVAPIQDLIDQWLGDLPTPVLFDLKSSIYDRAKMSFGQIIQLTEHFRCVPEIIQFSNHLSYHGKIDPLRDSAASDIKPALVPHRVPGLRKGKSNEVEAREIVSLIKAMVEMPEYAGKTIGVISLLGNEKDQVKTIEQLLNDKIDGVTLEQRRVLCGSPAQFQGDERDIIFHSMVDSNEGDGPLVMKGDGHADSNKKRYNVAASRAKDQLWVVYSLNHETQLQPGDLRRRLIEHALDPGHLMRALEGAGAKTESPFEKEVLGCLVSRGYKVHPQWRVGAYRIDLVVTGDNGSRLAVECDGDRWHYDKVAEDLARQALLERLGWKFVRIRGSAFYRNRDQAMESVFDRLTELGIHPAAQVIDPQASAVDHELRDKVIRRAAELRREWGWMVTPVTVEAHGDACETA